MPSITHAYAVTSYFIHVSQEERVVHDSEVVAVYPTLAEANLAAWREFLSSVNGSRRDKRYSDDNPPGAEPVQPVDGEEATVFTFDIYGEECVWRVGGVRYAVTKDETRPCVGPAIGGWSFVDLESCSGQSFEVAVLETTLWGFKVRLSGSHSGN